MTNMKKNYAWFLMVAELAIISVKLHLRFQKILIKN